MKTPCVIKERERERIIPVFVLPCSKLLEYVAEHEACIIMLWRVFVALLV